MMPAVSVVIPTYNRASSLARLLRALRDQKPPPGGFEVIVVDDGSTDETREVLEAAPEVRHLHQLTCGAASARNRGWQVASAPLIAFTDDDTVPSRTWLYELVGAIMRLDVAAVGATIAPLRQSYLGTFVQLSGHVDHGIDGDSVRYLVTANSVWRRSVLEELGGFDESFGGASGEDVDLCFRATGAGWFLATTDDALVHHDHRVSVVGLLGTSLRHGRARSRVVASHPDRSWRERRIAHLRPAGWAERHHRYRAAGVARPQAIGYHLLHAATLIAYAAGVVVDRLSPDPR